MSLCWLHVILYLKNSLSAQTQQNFLCSHLLPLYSSILYLHAKPWQRSGACGTQVVGPHCHPYRIQAWFPHLSPMANGQWAKTLIWSHSTALLLLVNCETICWTNGRFFYIILQTASSDGWDAGQHKTLCRAMIENVLMLQTALTECSQDIMQPMAKTILWANLAGGWYWGAAWGPVCEGHFWGGPGGQCHSPPPATLCQPDASSYGGLRMTLPIIFICVCVCWITLTVHLCILQTIL